MNPSHSLLQMIDTLYTGEDCKCKLTYNGEFEGLYKCKDCRERFTVIR